MAKVKSITSRQILDSRGIPTIGARMEIDSGQTVTVEISSGSSVGTYEAKEMRDNDPKKYAGMGVQTATYYINELVGKKLVGVDVNRLADIDNWLIQADGTTDRSKLGTNTITAISQLFLKAGAVANGMQDFQYINQYYNAISNSNIIIEKVPSPIVNVINGGRHGSSTLDFQEFHVIPQTANTFAESVEISLRIYGSIYTILEYRNVGTFLSEQGGYSPKLRTNIDALEVIKEAVIKERLRLGVDLFLGIDCASSYYFKDGKYTIKDNSEAMDEVAYLDFLVNMVKNYSVLVLEDPLSDDAHDGWKKLTHNILESCYVAGDDYVSGNKQRLEKIVKSNSCNSAIVKFGQSSTMTEIFEIIKILKKSNMKIIVSQRFGETIDTLIADLAVGIQADFVKFGSIIRGERVVKYNRLEEIEASI